MKRFVYICADSGIPLPGSKGASIHVESVVTELVHQGLSGQVFCARPKADMLGGVSTVNIKAKLKTELRSKESAQFLANCQPLESRVEGCLDFVLERYSLWNISGLAMARKLGCPFILEVNSPLPVEASQYRSLEQPDLASGVAALLMQEADGIICVSDEVASWVTKLRGNSKSVWTVANGFEQKLFTSMANVPDRAAANLRPFMLFCGTFRPWHGLTNLFEAFDLLVHQHHCDVDLLLIGDGPERESLEMLSSKRGLASRVRFLGKISHLEVPNYARHACLAVAPYPKLDDFYFSPLKIYEHMGLGLPVVASAIGQIPELLADGRGVLCEPDDPQQLAKVCAELISDEERRKKIGKTAAKWAHEHATWQARVRQILKHIESCR